MSAPQVHPIKRLRELAEESAMLLWKSYDLHHDGGYRDADWQQQTLSLHERCVAADTRVRKLLDLKLGNS